MRKSKGGPGPCPVMIAPKGPARSKRTLGGNRGGRRKGRCRDSVAEPRKSDCKGEGNKKLQEEGGRDGRGQKNHRKPGIPRGLTVGKRTTEGPSRYEGETVGREKKPSKGGLKS